MDGLGEDYMDTLLETGHSAYWSSENTLRTIDVAFRNQLTRDSPRLEQPSEIKLSLREHQKALLAAMRDREKASMEGYKFGNTKTYANFGVLGDEVGSGKSLVILSYIAYLKHSSYVLDKKNILFPSSKDNFFTVQTKEYKTPNAPCLIVVPHTIYRQWQDYCKQHTTLNIFYAKTSKTILSLFKNDISGNSISKEEILKSDAVLVSNTLLGEFLNGAQTRDVVWKRAFIDEIDSIYIPSTVSQINTSFTWFITATWANFLLNGTTIRPLMYSYYKDNTSKFSPELGAWLKGEVGEINTTNTNYNLGRTTWLRVRSNRWLEPYHSFHTLRCITLLLNSKAFLDESRQMPDIHYTTLMCAQPASHRAVSGIVSPAIQNMLHAGNIDGAMQELGIHSDTPLNLIEAVTKEREKELDRLKKTLAFKESIEYATALAKEQALQSLKIKIKSVEEQLKTFRDRLSETASEECPICYDNPRENAGTITPCCHRIFCGSCILNSLTRGLRCPMCRADIVTSQLIQLVKEEKTKKAKKVIATLLSKSKQLIKFLKENPEARVLVFSRYENPFLNLERDCDQEGISYHTLRGNKDVIASTVKSFENGEKRVLFLPTEKAGAGLNLVGATHVILFHAMTPEEEKQTVGRAYRLGRKEPLTVVKLLHEGEKVLPH